MDARPTIRPVAPDDLDALLAYLEEQMKENGTNGGPLFQPYGRATPWRASVKAAPFRDGLATALGAPGWRRVWAAYDASAAEAAFLTIRTRDPTIGIPARPSGVRAGSV